MGGIEIGKPKDIKGEKFGSLTAISPTEKRAKNGTIIWHFHCDCGNKDVYKSLDVIRQNNPKCPLCCKQNAFGGKRYVNHSVDLYKVGDKIGRLTIKEIKLNSNTYKTISYICSCDCGNDNVEIKHKNLVKGTRSCGCIKKEAVKNSSAKRMKLKDISGYRYGNLVAIKCLEPIKKTTAQWEFACDCGGTHIMKCYDFLRGRAKSCGCLKSEGEELIQKFLDIYNINYRKQVYFSDLKGKRGGYLRFDFGIYDDDERLLFLLEYDGLHHFKKTNLCYKEESVHDITVEHDSIKNNYCAENNIDLYRLNQIEKIDNQLKEILKKYSLIQSEE